MIGHDWRLSRSEEPLIAVALILALSTACNSPKPEPTPPPSQTAKPVEYFHVDAATAATIHGKVTFRGAKPARQPISMDAEAACAKEHAGKQVYDEPVVTNQ
jgi:hypothetical protein